MHSDPLPDWHVEQIPAKEARLWIPKYHYSGTVGTTNGKFYGAYDQDDHLQVVVGVGAPNNPYGVARRLKLTDWPGNYEITRVAAHPDAPRNAATRALALVGDAAHHDMELDWLFSYADTAQSHHGGIYQGLNAIYVGLTHKAGEKGYIFTVDGVKVHNRTLNSRFGTSSLDALRAAGHEIVCTMRSPKHVYILPIGDKKAKRAIRERLQEFTLPYPKRTADIVPLQTRDELLADLIGEAA